MSRYVISVDCSTTGSKAIVWDQLGNVIAEGRQEMPLSIPNDGWGEQNPEDWWGATRFAIKQAVEKAGSVNIEAIGLTHQRESFVCLDKNGRAIRPAMLWLDTRAHQEVKQFGTSEVHTSTGKPANPTPSFYKLMWLQANEPEVLQQTAIVADVHTYLSYRLTGKFISPAASVDPMGVLDLKTSQYSPAILKTLGITEQQLPKICNSGEAIGFLTPEAAAELGLSEDVLIVAGGGDGQCAGLGAGVVEPGIGYLNLGTGLIAGVYTEEYRPSYAYRAMMGTIAGSVNYEFFVGAGTYLVNWFKKHQNLGDTEGKSPEQYWNDRAAEVPIGSQGLFTLPYWNGALTPYWDQNARGAVVGYSGIHGNEHLFRSILEGIAFELRVCLDSASATLREPLSCLITMGGGARSPLWCQMLADILRIPISIAKSEESTALGAGMLAFAAVGAYPDARSAAKAMSGRGHTYEPNLENALEYDKYFEIYRSLYPALKPVFESLAEVS